MSGEIDVAELKRRRDAGDELVLLDVREPFELDICRLPDSVNIPLQTLAANHISLPKDKPIVAMCHHGGRSARATAWLSENGYDVVNLTGGIDAWAQQCDPEMERY